MPLAPKYSKTISDIAEKIYEFLPGNPHPYANKSISFMGVAHEMGLSNYWPGGSKLPAITILLSHTYEHQKRKFCNLIISIVNKGIAYRAKKTTCKQIGNNGDKRINYKARFQNT